MNYTIGTVERVTSVVRYDMADTILDADRSKLVHGAATVGNSASIAVGWTAYAAKTATDAFIGGTSRPFGVFQ